MKNILYFLFAVLLSLSCKTKESQELHSEHEELPPNVIEFSAEQYKTAGIMLDSLQNRLINKIVKVNGTITVPPRNSASVSAFSGGYVKSTEFLEGSYVSKGQVLAVIENPEFVDLQQNYLETKSKLDYAQKDYFRQKTLSESNANSLKTFQQAESEYNTLKAQLSGLIQKLKILNINHENLNENNIKSTIGLLAPISGNLKTVNVNIGKNISPNEVLFEIVNTENLILELHVFEKDILQIKEKQKINFTIPNQSGEIYSAEVLKVGVSLDDDKTAKVYATVEIKDKNLIPGMFVNAEILITENETLCLPAEAVVSFEEKFYVFTFKENAMENGKPITLFEAVEIVKGGENDGFTEIIFKDKIDYRTYKFVTKGAYSVLSKFKNSGEMSC